MHAILGEADRIRDLHRNRPDLHGDAEPFERRHQVAVEVGDRAGDERQASRRAVGATDDEHVVDEVEDDVERAPLVRNRGGGEATRRHVERHVPPMVLLRGERHPHLADDLRPHVERGVRVLPARERQRRPGVGRLRRRCRAARHAWLAYRPTSDRAAAARISFASGLVTKPARTARSVAWLNADTYARCVG